jgi:hypothetical protein
MIVGTAPPVLVVAIVERPVWPWPAIMLRPLSMLPVLRALALALGIGLRTRCKGGRLLPLALGALGTEGRLGSALGRGGKSVRNAAKIVIVVPIVPVLRFALGADEAGLRLLLGQLGGGDQAEVMLCVLQIAFRHDRVAGRMGVPRQLQVLFCDVVRGAANLYVRSVGFVRPGERVWALAVVATAHTLVLTWSH